MPCEICAAIQHLDRHHIVPKRMGGSSNPDVLHEDNLITLCRDCHQRIHKGKWELVRSEEGIQVLDSNTGSQVMRRLYNSELDVPALFQLLNQAEDSLYQLRQAIPYLTDEQLVEAFSYVSSYGKRSWLIQAAILYEAQQRSIYGERTLEAVARRFEIGLRQAQKYALVWKVFFAQPNQEETVNIDAILLDEPSWYVVAATETKKPEKWLAYAQDRKQEDPGYSVTSFRRDIQLANLTIQPAGEDAPLGDLPAGVELPSMEHRPCPWIKPFCTRSGKPVPVAQCCQCEFSENTFLRNEPTA